MTPFPKPPKREKAPRKPLKRTAPPRSRAQVIRLKKTKKRKGPSVRTLRERADALMSILVRRRDGKCVMTGRTDLLQGAHFYGKKARPAVRYDFMNDHALYAGKHMDVDRRDPQEYADWMRRHYTTAQLDALEKRSRLIIKRDRAYYEGIIAWLKSLSPQDVLALTWPKD